MSTPQPINLSQSVRQKLLNRSAGRHEDFNLVLMRYAMERFLYRLANSKHVDQFILKGASLFTAWTGYPHRPTQDLDLLGYGDLSLVRMRTIVQEVCQTPVEPDGLIFETQGLQIEEIREAQEYQGFRVRLLATLGSARIRLQIDIGVGDAVTPEPERIEYPTLLDLPAPCIRAYPRETVVAEKLQAMVALGILNSRLKDFYDIWQIARRFSFEGSILVQAIRATFARRKTDIPNHMPTALSDAFASDRNKNIQWKAFIQRSKLESNVPELAQVVEELRTFLMQPLFAAAENKTFSHSWTGEGPWMLAD